MRRLAARTSCPFAPFGPGQAEVNLLGFEARGTDKNPLFLVAQRAAALHATLFDVSRAEYEAVMDRLSRSAHTFDAGPGSTNYWRHALQPLLGRAR